LLGKYGKMKVYKCYYMNGVIKNFSKRKEKSSLPSLGCFWLNREEKIENEV
jgi:hypothetical protein